MAAKALPCPTLLRLLLEYNPETGKLYWKKRARKFFRSNRQFNVWNCRYAGIEAFTSVNGDGYNSGAVLSKSLKAHRVAWAISHGEWPQLAIDHINGDRHDNRLSNLRVVSSVENAKNARIPVNNTSGHVGVSWAGDRGKWSAYIRVNGTLIMLGYFHRIADAISARKCADIAYGFSPTHGLTQQERKAHGNNRVCWAERKRLG